MNVLIVGGAGYLGGAVTDTLAKSQHSILVYDLLVYEEMYRKSVPFAYGDIRDGYKIKKYLDWADIVIWLAALVGDPACELNRSLTEEVNVNSVRYLRDNFKGRIIYTSTCSVYGAQESILNEDSPVKPLSFYAKTKLMAEQALADANSLILRLGTLYGVSDRFSRIRFDLVVNTLVMRAMVHKKISIFGGKQYRPLLHVKDAASLICDILDKKEKGVYNASSANLSILEISDLIKEYFPELKVEVTEAMFQDTRNYRVSSEKAGKELGFKPVLTVEEGIKELKTVLEEGRIKNSFLSRFSNYLYLKPLLSEYKSPLGKTIELNM